MKTRTQHTIQKIVQFNGVGIHSGQPVNMTIYPSPPNTGIKFFLKKDGTTEEVLASYNNVCETHLCTGIGSNGKKILTIEHLMAALNAKHIDNAFIELDGNEIPVMDGSSVDFFNDLDNIGTVSQEKHRKELVVLKEVKIDLGDKSAALLPFDGRIFQFFINFKNSFIKEQSFSFDLEQDSFLDSIARARTFGFFEEISLLKNLGFAKGGSLENAVVIKDDKVMNEEGLRFHDEFVRHKILDAIGDLYTAGMPIRGKFIGKCSGHSLNNQLLKLLFSDENNFMIW